MNDSVFDRLYDQYHQDVFQFLIYLVKHRETAEDLMHEVYVRVLKAYDRFEGKSSEKTWLFSIAKNVSIDHFRKTNVRKKYSFDLFDWDANQFVSNEIPPADQALMNEETEKLLNALEKCTVDQKMVIILRYLQDLSISETATILGWTEGKVKTTQHRGIQKLKSILHALEEEES